MTTQRTAVKQSTPLTPVCKILVETERRSYGSFEQRAKPQDDIAVTSRARQREIQQRARTIDTAYKRACVMLNHLRKS